MAKADGGAPETAEFAGSRGKAGSADPLPARADADLHGALATKGAVPKIKAIVAWLQATRAMRMFQHYSTKRGPILASGLAYQALFSLFAGLWVLFSIAGLVLAGDDGLRQELVDALSSTLPGLIKTGNGQGAIDPDALIGASAAFSITGLIALAGGLFTSLNFLNSARDAVRDMFDLPQAKANIVVLKLKDLAFLVGFLVAIILSAALGIAGTAATGFLLGLIGIPQDSVAGNIVGRIVALVIVIAVDTAVVGAMLRVLAQVAIPWRFLRSGAVIGGAGAAVLTVAFQLGIIGGAGKNSLIASFIVILGLLVFFNFLCQVLLISASWTATGLSDRGIVVDEAVEQARLEAARRLVEEHDGPVVQGGFLARLFQRRPKPRVD